MLLRRQASEERDEHIDMTPMVDVVFQLMTFMLFSMQLTSGDIVQMPEARHGVGVEESAATFLMLAPAARPAARPRLLLGPRATRRSSVDEAVAAVSKGVTRGPPQGRPPGRRRRARTARSSSLIGEISRRESGATHPHRRPGAGVAPGFPIFTPCTLHSGF